MRHNLASLFYKSPGDLDWIDFGIIPGSGTIEVGVKDSDNGPVKTYKFKARLDQEPSYQRPPLHTDFRILALYDNGIRVILGTEEMPVRLQVQEKYTLEISAEWQKAL